MPSHLGQGMHVPYLDRGPKAMSEYHTLTNLPFKSVPKVLYRYSRIDRPRTTTTPVPPESPDKSKDHQSLDVTPPPLPDPLDESSKQSGGEYAKFLREHERTLAPSGFLDSRRYTHKYHVKKSARSAAAAGGGRVARNPKRTWKVESTFDSVRRPATAVGLSVQMKRDQREFEQKMGVIEDHMWKHKQEERELKRVEGDVNKSKRSVQRVARDFETSMNRKMLEAEKGLNESIQKTEKVRVEGVREREETTRVRIGKARADNMQWKKQGREKFLVMTNAQRRYKCKVSELEMRKEQVEKLTNDFEAKLKRHEAEANGIAQELATLAISMNMEAMKGRSVEHEMKRMERVQAQRYINHDRKHEEEISRKLGASRGINRKAENKRRAASASLSAVRGRISERVREGDRRVTDNKYLVERNVKAQRELQDTAEYAELEKRKKTFLRNVDEHNFMKLSTLEKKQVTRRKLMQERNCSWRERYEGHLRSWKEGRNRDLMGRFARVVKADESEEQKLYQLYRRAEGECKSTEFEVGKLEGELVKTRKKTGRHHQEATVNQNNHERNLSFKLQKSRGQLSRVQNQRTASQRQLHNYRGVAKESKHVYDELNREHKRLMEIGGKIDGSNGSAGGGFLMEQQQSIAVL